MRATPQWREKQIAIDLIRPFVTPLAPGGAGYQPLTSLVLVPNGVDPIPEFGGVDQYAGAAVEPTREIPAIQSFP
jgi:hypothetical protein